MATHKKSGHRWPPSGIFSRGSLHDGDALFLIEIREHHFDDLTLFRRHDLSYVIGLNRKLPVLFSSVNQDGQLHATRAAKVYQLIKRRTNRPPSVEHVVYQHYVAVLYVAWKLSAIDDRVCSDRREVVAVERDVEDTYGRASAFKVSAPCGDRT